MKVIVNLISAVLIIAVIILLVVVYQYFYHSDTDREEMQGGRKKKGFGKKLPSRTSSEESETVLVNMPTVSYRLPNGQWHHMALNKAVTTIGRSESCDIVVDDKTVSPRHARIEMKLRKKNAEKKGARYFILHNLSKENPISFLDPDSKENDYYDIMKTIPLSGGENIFFMGLVEVHVIVRTVKPKLAGDFTFQNVAPADNTKKEDNAVIEQKTEERADTADETMDEEIREERRKIIRRSPRSVNRV